MDTSTNGHSPAEGPPRGPTEDVVPPGWRWSFPRFLGIAAFLGMAIFWIWAFNNRDSIEHPDTFDDPVFTVAAETLCAKRQAAINALPLATAVDNPRERGELVALGTIEIEAMVRELGTLAAPTDPEGAAGVDRWLSDYQLYISDRERWTALLLNGEDPPFTLSGTVEGVRVTDLLTTFADVNEMASCGPSGDA